MKISLIVPALNEAGSIAQVLLAVPSQLVVEILVVDGGSTDGTAEIARLNGALVIREERRGYGRACASGLARASGEVVVFLDADGADDPQQLPRLVDPIRAGRAEMVLGSRLAGRLEDGAMLWHQRLGNQLSAALIRRLYSLPITDLSPFRAVLRARLLDLEMTEMTYGWPTEMIAKAARRGWRILEVPVDYRRRLSGKSKISGTFKGSLLATVAILRTILFYSRSGDEK
jgi:glycosyltransferase involved in cell wall biosynthesis